MKVDFEVFVTRLAPMKKQIGADGELGRAM